MKIILSRKGFDSASGGVPSPIMPDGRLVSLPIPYEKNELTFGQLALEVDGDPIGKLVTDLTRNRFTDKSRCHLDPDLNRDAVRRRPVNWRPAFGQSDRAQRH